MKPHYTYEEVRGEHPYHKKYSISELEKEGRLRSEPAKPNQIKVEVYHDKTGAVILTHYFSTYMSRAFCRDKVRDEIRRDLDNRRLQNLRVRTSIVPSN